MHCRFLSNSFCEFYNLFNTHYSIIYINCIAFFILLYISVYTLWKETMYVDEKYDQLKHFAFLKES